MVFFRRNTNTNTLSGFEPIEKILPAKIKRDTVISRQLNYKFNRPETYTLNKELVSAYDWGDDTYLDFLATTNGATVGVVITIDDFDDTPNVSWTRKSREMSTHRIEDRFVDVKPGDIEFVNFLGMDCAHYSGILKKSSRRVKVFEEVYVYQAPRCHVVFNARCDAEEKHKIRGVFDRFEAI